MLGGDGQARAFPLRMKDVYPEESTYQVTQALVKVQAPVKAFMGGVSVKKGNTKVTLQ